MTSSRRVICKVRGCQRPVDGESYYGRCYAHLYCAHCDLREPRVGGICDSCREYERTHDGRQRPADLIELQRRRYMAED